ncbi:F-box domain containing protein [Pandoravirus neocaledonia]|uniref:F-box domain containing protein n=1 Tax=Pandoravirus neocaledonia TaxID=2107708 RepID=A0A2U7UBN1_9VIRU|nr:F-box domain containing protein [Pandoravirus neocaledonia]AVK75730.1 F-box domain containing protein [Pandoravirus neocaledonia]
MVAIKQTREEDSAQAVPACLMDLPDECLLEIAHFVGALGTRWLASMRAASRRLERVCGEPDLWRSVFRARAGAPLGTPVHRLRPSAWADEPWWVSARRVARPLDIRSGCVSLSVQSVWTGAFDPRDGIAVWAASHDTEGVVSCRHGPLAAVQRVVAHYATHRTQCHVWLAEPVDTDGGGSCGSDGRLSGGRVLWRPLRLMHAFNAAETITIPWNWWWALVSSTRPMAPDAPLRAHFIVIDLWWIDPSDRTGDVPRCVAAAHRDASPSYDGSRGAHPWYEADFALRHVVGCACGHRPT